MMAPAKVVSPAWGTFAICATILSCVFFGAAFATEYEGSCTPNAEGVQQCTQNFKWKGFAGVPIEPLATAFGTCMGTYISLRTARRKVNGSNPNPDVSSSG